jgi:transposase
MREEKNVKIYRRLEFIKFKDEWKKNTEIMKIIWVSINTLSDWTTKYLKEWMKWLWILNYDWRRIWKLAKNKEKIKEYVKLNIVSTLSELKAWLKKELDIDIQNSWLWEFCKKNWIFLIKK